MSSSNLQETYRMARRVVVTVIGITVLLIGVTLLVLPGPAILVIPAGLAILGLEYAWARRWLKAVKAQADRALARSRVGRQAKEVVDKMSKDGK